MIKTNYPIETADLSNLSSFKSTPHPQELTDLIYEKFMKVLINNFGMDDDFGLKYAHSFLTIIRDQIESAMLGLGMGDEYISGTPKQARYSMTDYTLESRPNDITSRECLIAIDFSNGVVFDIHVALQYDRKRLMVGYSRSIPRKDAETCFVFNSFNKTERALCDLTCDTVETEAWAHNMSFDDENRLYIGYKIAFNDSLKHFNIKEY